MTVNACARSSRSVNSLAGTIPACASRPRGDRLVHREIAGVSAARLRPCNGGPGEGGNDRFNPSNRACGTQQSFPIAQTFQVQGNDLAGRIAGEIVQHIGWADIAGITEGRDNAHPTTWVNHVLIKDSGDVNTALGHDTNPTGAHRSKLADGGMQAIRGVDEATTVGSPHGSSGSPRALDDSGLDLLAVGARLGETRGRNQHRWYSEIYANIEGGLGFRGWAQEDGEIHRTRDLFQRTVTPVARYPVRVGVDWIDVPGEAAADVIDGVKAVFAVGAGGTDYRDAAGFEEVTHAHAIYIAHGATHEEAPASPGPRTDRRRDAPDQPGARRFVSLPLFPRAVDTPQSDEPSRRLRRGVQKDINPPWLLTGNRPSASK